MGILRGRVELDDVRSLAGGELRDAGAGLGIPQLHHAIVGSGEELGTAVVEADVGDGLGMAGVRAQQLPLVIDVPYLDGVVGAGGEKQVAGVGEEAQGGDSLSVVVLPGVYQLLGDEVGDAANLLAQIDIEVLGNVHVGAPLVIVQAGAVECGRFVAHLLNLLPPL